MQFPTYLGLRTGEIYYLCVNVTKDCSDGFVIDNVPPSSGNVKVHNHYNGYINSNSTITVLWHDFADGSHFKEFLYPSTIDRYDIAIGTHLDSQDILSFTHCGLSESSVLTNVSLTNGMTYYFFIRAFDHAGNNITSSSDRYIFDSTPPTTGMITVGSYIKSLTMVNPGSLIVHWSGIEDRESGIDKYEIGIRTFNEQVSAYFSVNKNTFPDLRDYFSFIDGHQYRVNLKAWNNAGLYSTMSSAPFIFDASPPLVGVVRDGPLENGVDLMFSNNVSSLPFHWTNFHDPHSMISNYRVGLGTAPKKTNILPVTDVGLRKEWTWFKSFRRGVKYFATVESCNKAGLCSVASSNGIILDDSPPIPGRVLIGGNNDRYVPDNKTLRVSLVDFIDAESGILQYFVCLGSKKFLCDVKPWKNCRNETSILLFNLNMPLNQSIYAVVKAENKAGLASSASSDEFFVDVTPPIVLFPPNVIKSNSLVELYDSSLLRIQWKFKDNESPLSKGLISLQTNHNSKTYLDDIVFYGDETRTIPLDTSKWLSSGDKYKIVVTSCNAARLCTSSESDEIIIDSTPPFVGHILDNAVWSNNDLNVMLKWKDFVDPETQVVAYYLHLSETLYGREISGHTIKVAHDGDVHEEQKVTLNISRKLVQNEKIMLSLSAQNNVGLNSTARHVTFLVLPTNNNMSHGRLLLEKHSCDSLSCTNDCTCSAIGKKCSNNIAGMQCKELNFTMKPFPNVISDGLQLQHAYTLSTRCLSAHWNSTNDMIVRYEWSVGVKGFPIGYGVFNLHKENPWKDIGLETQFVYCLPPGKQFKHMHSYVIFLRSWITDTDYVMSESKPVTIDTSPPKINRGKAVLDSLDNCATHSHSGKTFHNLTTCWDGVFSDQQSGIKNYNVFVGTVPGGHDVSGILNIGLKLNFTWHFSNLHPGVKYFSTVQAVNNVGLQTTLFSSGILIDDTSPSVGIVYNTAFFQNIPRQTVLTSLTASWQGFADHESFISSYLVALVDSDGNIIKHFENVGIRNKHTFSNLTLNFKKLYIFLVKAQNSVGLKSNAARSHQISFDVSKPKGMKCQLYSQIIYNSTISSFTKENLLSGKLNVTKGQYRFKVHIHAHHKFRHDSIHVLLKTLTMKFQRMV
ncbi:uncharacterized protein LOC133191190 [Saccostrea echinata]|uniref:uncharacterized protein LOC133191190 n=1 Tax=Saccostrea echinata TaxID=191078 RepID=UPI002A83422E|nr:uncharacterized protein LOC133191190 [Saccostrea echinata]